VLRYVRLLRLQLRMSALLAAQYRWDFITDGIISAFWAATAVVPLFIVYGSKGTKGIPGWTFGESLVVTGMFILMQAVLEGAINPGLQAVVEHIRTGTMDFILLKPADAQFLVSTSRFRLWQVLSVVNAGIVLTLAFQRVGHLPSPSGIGLALLLLVCATWILYSLWILIISAAFFVVKVDNLTYLFSSVFDAARWPATVFRGVLRFVITFVVPLALMTTFPAEALLGRLPLMSVAVAIGGTVVFSTAARLVWLKSIGHYTSAGG